MNNAIYILTGDVDGSIAGLNGQFLGIAKEYIAVSAQNEQLVVNELEGALLELSAFQEGYLSYKFVMEQIADGKSIASGLRSDAGSVWNEKTAQKMNIVNDLQELRLRQLSGEDVSAQIAQLSADYKKYAIELSGIENLNDAYYTFATQVARQLGLVGW